MVKLFSREREWTSNDFSRAWCKAHGYVGSMGGRDAGDREGDTIGQEKWPYLGALEKQKWC